MLKTFKAWLKGNTLEEIIMSLLTEALNRIRAWIETNYPKSLVSIPPGLHLSEIQEIVQRVPFKLSNEVYELYEWSCGIEEEASYDICYDFIPFDPSDSFYLCNLEQIVREPTFENEFGRPINYLGQPLFQIFQAETTHIFMIGNTEQKESSPVILWTGFELILRYTSLTAMMLTLAECLETGVFYESKKNFRVNWW